MEKDKNGKTWLGIITEVYNATYKNTEKDDKP